MFTVAEEKCREIALAKPVLSLYTRMVLNNQKAKFTKPDRASPERTKKRYYTPLNEMLIPLLVLQYDCHFLTQDLLNYGRW